MQQRRLGADGPLISAIGIGAMSFSDFYGATDEGQSHAILETAVDEVEAVAAALNINAALYDGLLNEFDCLLPNFSTMRVEQVIIVNQLEHGAELGGFRDNGRFRPFFTIGSRLRHL